ncbi:MAG: hypothetical protein LBR27_11755 [Bifidobacteriaceae bacterium]|nr:hypothetical protein [Bifidobacteriaceae bacterium]
MPSFQPDYSDVRGFNYHSSVASTGLENWLRFDAALWERELTQGKAYFPKFNLVRYWLSWDAYFRDPAAFKANFETALTIADQLDLKVIPCLLNRWHDIFGLDYGGVYLDNIIVPSSWAYYRPLYRDYVTDIVGSHQGDRRVEIWDLCNEPWSYSDLDDFTKPLVPLELEWLQELYATAKAADPAAKVSVSTHNGHDLADLTWVEPISDVMLVHPYFICNPDQIWDQALRDRFVQDVEYMVDFGRKVGKPVLVTETCWGALKDSDRVDILRFTLDTLAAHNLGFMAWVLHSTPVADAHAPDVAVLGRGNNCAFTTSDGALRPGHDIFNQY